MTLSESVSVCALDSLTSADLTIHLCVVTTGECDIYINTDAFSSKQLCIQGTHYHAFLLIETSDLSVARAMHTCLLCDLLK